MTSLDLQSEEPREPPRRGGKGLALLLVLFVLALGGLGWLAYESRMRTRALEEQLANVSGKAEASAALARQALDRATAAETAARAAAEARQTAEAQSADARKEADTARLEASTANETAARAQAEAAAIRKKAEAEVNRLEEALGQIVETRRTALGVVMNLGEDHLEVRVRQGRPAAAGPGAAGPHRRDPRDVARLHDLGERPHGRRGVRRLQPEALRAAGPSRARLPGEVRPAAGDLLRHRVREDAASPARQHRRRPRQEPPGRLGIVNIRIRYGR